MKKLRRFSTFVLHKSWLIGVLGVAVSGFFLIALLNVSKVAAIIPSLLTLTSTIGIVVTTFQYFEKEFREKKAKKQRQKKQLKTELDSCVCDDCTEIARLAAVYEGWHGTVHMFWFASKKFASLFRMANPRKCLNG